MGNIPIFAMKTEFLETMYYQIINATKLLPNSEMTSWINKVHSYGYIG